MLKNNLFQKTLGIILIIIALLIPTTLTYNYYQQQTQTENINNNQLNEQQLEDNQIEEEEKPKPITEPKEEIKPEETEKEDEVEVEKQTTKPPVTVPDPEPTPEPEQEEEEEEEPEVLTATVIFYADNQSDSDADDANHQRAVNYILATGANPIFHAGDLMEDGTQDSLDRFNTVTQTLRSTRTFYSAIGNNDRKVGDSTTPSQLYLDNFTYPNNELWYSINYGNLHMTILDSAFNANNQTQMNWLINDLQTSASQDRITGVMFHHPTFKENIKTHLINYGADFVISGHYHSYSHTSDNGIHYFVLSGQPNIGYIKAKIYSNHVEMTVYNHLNSIIDTISFEER